MVSNTTISLLFIMFMCTLTRNSYSFEYDQPELDNDDVLLQAALFPFMVDENALMKRPVHWQSPSFPKNRRLEPGAKYSDLIRKTPSSADSVREKRFWLFAKKDEHDTPVDLTPHVKSSPNSLTQGLWRSGIVGRRR